MYYGLISKPNILNSERNFTVKFKPPLPIIKKWKCNNKFGHYSIWRKKPLMLKILFAKSFPPQFKMHFICNTKVSKWPHSKQRMQISYKRHNILKISFKIICIIHIFTDSFHPRRKQGFRVILCVILFTLDDL